MERQESEAKMTRLPRPKEKAKSYIDAARQVLKDLKKNPPSEPSLRTKTEAIIELAASYVADASHYLEKGQVATGLTCVSYAEGLLDALKILGWLNYEWKTTIPHNEKERKVVVAGTWDIIHPGHLWLLNKAKEYGHLTVIVARDSTSQKIKGHGPVVPESQRLQVVQGLKPVDKAILGHEGDILEIIGELKPDLIILGPNQRFNEKDISQKLKNRGLDVQLMRMKEAFRGCELPSSSKIAQEAALKYASKLGRRP